MNNFAAGENIYPTTPYIPPTFETPPQPVNVPTIVSDAIKRQDSLSNSPLVNLDLSSFSKSKEKPFFQGQKINIEDQYAIIGDKFIFKYNNYYQGVDNNEYYANLQSTWSKWRNGLTKNGIKAVNYIADGAIGFVNGIINLINEGNLEAYANNEFSTWIDEQNKRLDYQLPNYVSREEANMSFLRSLGTANFWANDVAGGVAFIIGVLGSEVLWAAATGGSSLALSGAKIGARFGAKTVGKALTKAGLGVVDDALRNSAKRALSSYARTVANNPANLNTIARYGTRGANTIGFINNARFMATSSGFEAAVEARGSIDENVQAFQQAKLQSDGRLPTYDGYKEFFDDAIDASNKVFLSNMAILSLSNVIQFGKFVGLSNKILPKMYGKAGDYLSAKLFGKGLTRAVDGTVSAIRGNRVQRLAGKAYDYFKNPIVEGWEEGSQGLIKKYQGGYLESKYNPQSTKTNYDGIDMFRHAFSESFLSKEGFKEVGIGMIIGKLGNFSGGAKAGFKSLYSSGYNAEIEGLQSQAENINEKAANLNTATRTAIERTLLLNQQLYNTQRAEEASLNGDDNSAHMFFNSASFSKMMAEEQAGMLEESVENFKFMVSNFKSDELAQEMGIDVSQVEDVKVKMIDEYVNNAAQFKISYRFAEALNPQVKGKKDLKSKHYIEEVTHNHFMGAKAIERLNFLGQTIEEAVAVNGFADQIAYVNSLESNQIKTAENISERRKEIEKLNSQYAELQQSYSNLLERNKRVEENTAVNNSIEKNRIEAEKVKNQRNQLEKELQEIESQLDLSSIKNDFAFGNLFDSQFVDLDTVVNSIEELQKLDDYLENVSKTNPNKAQVVEDLLRDYKESYKYLDSFNKGFQDLISGKFNYTNYKGIQKLFTNPKKYEKPLNTNNLTDRQKQVEADIEANELDEYEAFQYRVLQDMSHNMYQGDFTEYSLNEEIEAEEWQKFVDSREVSEERQNSLAEKLLNNEGLSNREQRLYEEVKKDVDNLALQAKVEALKKSKGDSIFKKINNKISPLSDENYSNIQIIRDLIEQILKSKNYLEGMSINDVNEEDVPTEKEYRRHHVLKNKEQLSPRQKSEYDKLNQKIMNWGKIEGTFSGKYSLSDLYSQLFTLENIENETDGTEDIQNGVEPTELIPAEEMDNSVSQTKYNILQTYDKAFFKKEGGKISIHNLSIGGLIETLNKKLNVTKIIINGKEIILGSNKYPQGTKLKSAEIHFVGTDSKEYIVYIKGGERGTLVLDDKAASIINNNSNIRLGIVLNGNNPLTAYNTVIEVIEVEDGKTKMIPLNSSLEGETTVFDIEAIQNINEGDELEAFVDLTDTWNSDLVDKYNEDGDEGYLAERLKITYKKGNSSIGLVKQDLPSNYLEDSSHKRVKEVRAKAAKEVIDNQALKEVRIGVKDKVKKVFVGHPALNIIDNNIQLNDIIEQDIKSDKIDDIGYIENGKINTRKNNNNDRVSLSFVRRILNDKNNKYKDRKIPIIILNFAGKKIAYPVALKPTIVNNEQALLTIVDSLNKETVDKVNEINTLLAKNNIDADKIGLRTDNYSDAKIEEIRQLLIEQKQYVKVKDFTDTNIPIETVLVGNATINIDLNGDMFHSPKVVMDYGENNTKIETIVNENIIEDESELEGDIEETPTKVSTDISKVEDTIEEEVVATLSYEDIWRNKVNSIDTIREYTDIKDLEIGNAILTKSGTLGFVKKINPKTILIETSYKVNGELTPVELKINKEDVRVFKKPYSKILEEQLGQKSSVQVPQTISSIGENELNKPCNK